MRLQWVLGIGCLLLALGWWRSHRRIRRGNRRRGRIARGAEVDAEQLLAEAGFDVLERQATRRIVIEVDGEPVEAIVRADLLVKRGRRRYVAEVKTAGAVDPARPGTRRQLLEYLLVYRVDGVVLVDMTNHALREVRFPGVVSG